MMRMEMTAQEQIISILSEHLHISEKAQKECPPDVQQRLVCVYYLWLYCRLHLEICLKRVKLGNENDLQEYMYMHSNCTCTMCM